VYASVSDIQTGAKIEYATLNEAFPMYTYRIKPSGVFQSMGGGLATGEYGLQNDYFRSLTFGLIHSGITVGNETLPEVPINAEVINQNNTIVFTPTDTIHVFLQENASEGTVLSTIPSHATRIVFDENTTQQTITYNSETGSFIPTM